ncbi:MAG TPA: nuclear transport factor 2 family protein [Verrucomicrobiae bacterium]|nr:nuclear transport factor 2 family protein [Verrucomicrobiae bacterium]
MRVSRRLVAAAAGAAIVTACASPSIAEGSSNMLTQESLSDWLNRYGAAWTARDARAAGALFSQDATYHEMPFDAAMQGRAAIEAYWARVTEPQSNIRFTHNIVAVQGLRGVAHWNCVFNAGGATIELDGVFVLIFDARAQAVSSLREWWHARTVG